MKSAPNITIAFRALRKQGMVCKQDFLCCASCAGAWLGLRHRGAAVCYFTEQDADRLRAHGYVHIRFGMVGYDNDARVTAIGKRIATALRKAGCVVEWNGDPGMCIKAWRDAETYRQAGMKRLGARGLDDEKRA